MHGEPFGRRVRRRLTQRPHLQHRRTAIGTIWAVLRRELGARMLTSAYVWSTLVFAAVSFASPLLLSLGGEDDQYVLAITQEASDSAPILVNAAQDAFEVDVLDPNENVESALRDGAVDVVLSRGTTGESPWTLTGLTSVEPDIVRSIQNLLTTTTLFSLATEAGISQELISDEIADSAVSIELVDQSADARWETLLSLGFGAVIVFVIVLWGATMAGDVVQEKATRVVEIIVATIHPWQLLAGKVIAITIVGLLQIVIVLGVAYGGIELFSGGIDLSMMSPDVAIAGIVGVLVGVPLMAMLMAAMSARVEHQDDLGAATQPVYILLMAPFAAAVYVGLNMPNSIWMEILSLAPITNIFAMPVRVAAVDVPLWQLALSLLIALITLTGSGLLAGRIYSNSILKAGTTVSLKQSLSAD